MTTKKKLSLAVAAALSASGMASIALATDLYTETWSGGSIGSAYTVVHSTTANAAMVASGILTTTAGSSGVTTGNVQVSTPVSGGGSLYDPSFNPQLDLNGDSNLLTWNLNLQESRSNPSGFANTNSGVAYVLGATDANFLGAGEGYAVTIGSTLTDPVCLIHYTAGMSPIGTGAKSAPYNIITAPGDASQHYESVKVTYAPGTNTWKLYVRDDGTVGFADAINNPVPDANIAGSAVLQASATPMSFSGFLQTHTSTANDLGRFDNIKLSIGAAPVTTPRNLLWDADATGAATDGAGTWSTANTWIDQVDGVTHATWDGSRPDNAIFGTGTGTTGSAVVDVGSSQSVGMITFAASSTSYTLANGTLTIQGFDDDANPATTNAGLQVNQSSTISSAVSLPGAATFHVDGSGTTLTVNGAIGGGGKIIKFGTGTMVLNAPGTRSGDMDINTGTVRVTSSSVSGGISGLGTGQTNIKSGATLWFDATGAVGTSFAITSAGGTLFIGDQSTLRVTGNVTYGKNNPMFSAGSNPTAPLSSTIHVDSGGFLTFRAQLKNSTTTPENFHTIHVDGPGTVKITNSASDAGGTSASDIFGGSWDLSNGTMILGQNSETGGSSGDTLNALGEKGGDPKNGNTITIRGTGTLVATENLTTGSNPSLDFYRAKVIMSGGTLASGNGKDTSWGANFTTATGTTSTIATYDPLNPAVARSVTLKRGGADLLAFQADTTWNGNLVIDPGATTGGAFNVNREAGGVITVTPGVSITVNQGATLNLGGDADGLSDGVNNVNIINNSTSSFNVTAGDKNVGTVDGVGNTTVNSGTSLTADHLIQNAVNLNGNAHIRPNSHAAGVSHIRTLNIDTVNGVKLNLEDNKLITRNAAGTFDGTNYTGVTGLVVMGKGSSNLWDGTAGIITTQSDAVGSNKTAIGVAQASDVRPATATATATWAGQAISGSDTLVMYTYGGDANLDGKINIDDYVRIDQGIAGNETGWSNGDFNYDGKVNIDDYTTVIDSNVGGQGAPFDTAGGVGGGGSGVTAVPEPASIALLSLGATALLARRRRKN